MHLIPLATHISGFSFYAFDLPTCFQLNIYCSDVALLESLDHSCMQTPIRWFYTYPLFIPGALDLFILCVDLN